MTILSEEDKWPKNPVQGGPVSASELIYEAIAKWSESNQEPPTHISIPLEFSRIISKQFEGSWCASGPRGTPDEIGGLIVIWNVDGPMLLLRG